jgi:translocation and assembly module TamB
LGKLKVFLLIIFVLDSLLFLLQKLIPIGLDIDGLTVQINPLPLLIGQPLDIDVTIDDPNLYIEQDQSGEWVVLPETEGEGELNLPIDIEPNIDLNNANVSVLPYGFKELG